MLMPRACGALLLCGLLADVGQCHGGQYWAPGERPARGPRADTTGVDRRVVAEERAERGWTDWWQHQCHVHLRWRPPIETAQAVADSDDVFLGVRRKIGGVDLIRIADHDRIQRIAPALRDVLAHERQRDIVTACLVALAKLRVDDPAQPLLSLFVAHLREPEQEVRETAALAIGIAGLQAGYEPLAALLRDAPAGRELVAGATVDVRTRAFAAHALGLLAWEAVRDEKLAIARTLADFVRAEREAPPELRAAAIQALALVRPAADDAELRELVAQVLLQRFGDEATPAAERAQVPAALARVLGRGGEAADAFAGRLATLLAADRGADDVLAASAALALGALVVAAPPGKPFSAAELALRRFVVRGKQDAARGYAMLALARIGGAAHRDLLVERLQRARGPVERAWAAVALGEWVDRSGQPDPQIGDLLLRALRKAADIEAKGPLAIALGLARHAPAAAPIGELLVDHRRDEELCGHAAVALGMIRAEGARTELRFLLRGAATRPHLLAHVALALGRLGDREIADMLLGLLWEEDLDVPRLAAIASSLGTIAERRSIDTLLGLLTDAGRPPLVRAFAAVALGGIGDPAELPWNTKIAVGVNPLAVTGVLSDGTAGILDIL